MASDPLFTQEIVKEFILAQGGQVTNTVLVAHFRNFLSDPVRKVANRQVFKTFVNNLTIVKVDEVGVKTLTLRKKFREGYVVRVPTKKREAKQVSANLNSSSVSQAEDSNSFPSEMETSKEEPEDSSETPASTPLPPTDDHLFLAEERKTEDPPVEEEPTGMGRSGEESGVESPSVKERDFSSEVAEETIEIPSVLKRDPPMEMKEEPEGIRESFTPLSEGFCQCLENYFLGPTPEVKESSFESAVRQELGSAQRADLTFEKALTFSSTSSGQKEAKDVTDKGTSSEFKDAVPEGRVLRVKDAAMNIERLEREKPTQLKGQLKTKRETRKPLGSDSSSFLDTEPSCMTDVDRDWLLVSCKSDYQAMCKVLQEHPHLAPKRDFITGYNALHWASKNGNADVVKLLCGKYSVDPNIRTSGGYTSLHLAAMTNREEITDLLTKVYRADTKMRDYSGRIPRYYLNSAASSGRSAVLPRTGNYNSLLNASMLNSSMLNSSIHSIEQYPSVGPRTDKENSAPAPSHPLPQSDRPFPYQDHSDLMPPPSKLPPVKRRPVSAKVAHSDSEATNEDHDDRRQILDTSGATGGSTPNFETAV